jgi:hypothetical protein
MEDNGTVYGHLVYFTSIWYILCMFFGIFFLFWYFVPRIIWQPCCAAFHFQGAKLANWFSPTATTVLRQKNPFGSGNLGSNKLFSKNLFLRSFF